MTNLAEKVAMAVIIYYKNKARSKVFKLQKNCNLLIYDVGRNSAECRVMISRLHQNMLFPHLTMNTCTIYLVLITVYK